MPRSSTKKKTKEPGSAYSKVIAEMKHYEVVELDEDGVWGTLRCPKDDCEGEFKVKREDWKNSRESIGRSCPYCFRTSAKPGTEITAAGLSPGSH